MHKATRVIFSMCTLPIVAEHELSVRCSQAEQHQQKTFLSRRNGSIRVVAVRQSGQRHPPGGVLHAWLWYNALRCISPSHRSFTVSPSSVSLLFHTNTLALGPIMTIHRKKLIGYAHASGLQCDGWCCETLALRSFYQQPQCKSLFPNYIHHSESPDLCGYSQSITCSVCLLSYY